MANNFIGRNQVRFTEKVTFELRLEESAGEGAGTVLGGCAEEGHGSQRQQS